jgi:drug/metabolite transporter (DMT)-like permease
MSSTNNNSGNTNTGSSMKGILFILIAAFFFSLMTVFVRLSGDLPTMQKAFFRNVVAAVVALVLLVRSGSGTG